MRRRHDAPPPRADWAAWRDYLARRRGHGRHEWHAWQSYLAVHEGKLRQYAPHFLVRDDLRPSLTDVSVVWLGTLRFADGLEIIVAKDQELDTTTVGGPHVRTATYAYQILRRLSTGESQLWRYDNTHIWSGHSDAHHLHLYIGTGEPVVVHIGEWGWPTLGDVVDDLYAWWERHSSE